MKKITNCKLLIFVLILSVFTSACTSSKYKDGVSCKSLAESVTAQMPAELDFRELDASFRDFYFGEAEGYDDCYVLYSADNEDISEIGVFHCVSDKEAENIEGVCYEYIADLQQNSRAFIASYAPEELTKLDSADVRRYGKYVVYTVLDSADSQMVFDTVRGVLEE